MVGVKNFLQYKEPGRIIGTGFQDFRDEQDFVSYL